MRVEEVHTRSRNRRRRRSCNKNLNSGISLQWLLIYILTCNTVMGTKHEGICFYSKVCCVCVCVREREREREREEGFTKSRLVVEEDDCSKNSKSGTNERIPSWTKQSRKSAGSNKRTNERSFKSPVKASRVQRKPLASATGACGIPWCYNDDDHNKSKKNRRNAIACAHRALILSAGTLRLW